MNKELNAYNEYNLPFDVAKNLGLLEITYSMCLDDIKRLFEECEKNGNSDLLSTDNVLVVMSLPYFDIELTHYFINDNTNKLDIGFFCCKRYEDGSWESDDFADLDFSLELLQDKNKFEKAMYNAMILHMKNKNLYWSKGNINTL